MSDPDPYTIDWFKRRYSYPMSSDGTYPNEHVWEIHKLLEIIDNQLSIIHIFMNQTEKENSDYFLHVKTKRGTLVFAIHYFGYIAYVLMASIPSDMRMELREWLKGQTRPLVPDIENHDAVLLTDLKKWLSEVEL